MQRNVLEYFERGALRQFPDQTAVVDGTERYTFAALERYAKSCANRLISSTDRPAGPVAVFLPKSAATVIADLGILYSGNFYTNLDVKSPLKRLENILANVDPELVVTNHELRTQLLTAGVEESKIVCIDSVLTEPIQYDENSLRARVETVIDTDPLCIINTSGSTGTPKSVVLSHRGVIDFIDWVTAGFEFRHADIMGSLSPFHFDIYLLELFVSLAKGCSMAIIPEQLSAFPAKLVEFLADRRVSFIFWVPTVMVNISNMDLLKAARLECLRRVFFAGEVFPTRHLNYWRRHLPAVQFVNLYGPIEISVDCTYFVVDREFRDDEPLPIGFPCRNTDILIFNEQNQPAKANEPGELCVRGSSLALGYWNNPEQTAKAFPQNPRNPHFPEVIYRTGDSVYRNERGEIMFIGRKDFQIKHMGYRIELAEIENAVLTVPQIHNACVLYHRERKEITLFFEAAEKLTPAGIRQRLTDRLPKYMLPTVFHQLDTLPRNPNGKIDRQALAISLMSSVMG
jgi:amino acid adenylation domain-containing protein